jgi:hydroxycarboxylate dehydrogenase B
MPTLRPEYLQKLGRDIFCAVGVAAAEAESIARILVRANLQGHDSHGAIRFPQYVQECRTGKLNPRAQPVVVREGPATALMDGQRAFGQIVAQRAMALAIRKAREVGIAAVGVRQSGHMGRLADYVEMASAQDMVAFLYVNSSGAGQWMAPWGGREGRLSTNPLAFACPAGATVPISLDISTSAAPEGRVRVKRNRREQTPAGWLLDAEGQPTTDPEALYRTPRGTLLPSGGHKGYALAVMVEVLAGILGRAGHACANPETDHNGFLIVVLDISRFLPVAEFKEEVDALTDYVTSSPLAPGFTRVLTPGEGEALIEKERAAEGIFIEEGTWEQIIHTAKELGVAV